MMGELEGLRITSFCPCNRGGLKGFATVELPCGLILYDVGIHAKCGRVWASLGRRVVTDRDGRPHLDSEGRPRWTPSASFSSRRAKDEFCDAVVDSLFKLYPDLRFTQKAKR
jgi:hypothetical protein